MTTAILFTGKVFKPYLNRLIEYTELLPYKFASVWNNENPEYLKLLADNNFILIINDIKTQELYQYQSASLFYGINFIKNYNIKFDYVLRTRFDILTKDYNKYIEFTKPLFQEKLTVLAGISTDTNYFLDIIVGGKLEDMCNFYTLIEKNHPLGGFIERILQEKYFNKSNLSKDDIYKLFNFSLDLCLKNGIEFIWYRPSHWYSRLLTSVPDLKVIEQYCRQSFILI